MSDISDEEIQNGDTVEFDWGLSTLTGRAIEIYGVPLHENIVIAVDPGMVSTNTTTVTVPLATARRING